MHGSSVGAVLHSASSLMVDVSAAEHDDGARRERASVIGSREGLGQLNSHQGRAQRPLNRYATNVAWTFTIRANTRIFPGRHDPRGALHAASIDEEKPCQRTGSRSLSRGFVSHR